MNIFDLKFRKFVLILGISSKSVQQFVSITVTSKKMKSLSENQEMSIFEDFLVTAPVPQGK